MGSSYLGNAGVFLVQTILGLILLAIMLRFLLQIVRADFRNPVGSFLIKVTDPLLKPLRRYIPGFGGIDAASIVLLMLVQGIELVLVGFIIGNVPAFTAIVVISFAQLLGLVINVFIFSILIQVILSWVSPGSHNPITGILYALNEPLLSRARRIIPAISGFDLSPIVVMVFLQLISMLVVAPIGDMAGAVGR